MEMLLNPIQDGFFQRCSRIGVGLKSVINNPDTFCFQTVQVRPFVRNFRSIVSYVAKRQFAA